MSTTIVSLAQSVKILHHVSTLIVSTIVNQTPHSTDTRFFNSAGFVGSADTNAEYIIIILSCLTSLDSSKPIQNNFCKQRVPQYKYCYIDVIIVAGMGRSTAITT